ncbi:conserved hypothetical protein [Culex quinquefasciatus]|uniref:Uncharacterized protein n=1 Tax=Culex quinquefasciatus TaxID=7176 RepID=B0WGJ4_CULQU|nr:conserved hypothetical protein [Culex quinquefasciatus]|eukprot:XP_001847828.1 conserved hypothetical protein [Culex quinquefasciatus]
MDKDLCAESPRDCRYGSHEHTKFAKSGLCPRSTRSSAVILHTYYSRTNSSNSKNRIGSGRSAGVGAVSAFSSVLEAPTTGAEDWKDGADALAFPRTRLRIDKGVFSLSRDSAIRIRIVPIKFSCISTLIGYGLSYSSRAVQILRLTSDYLMPPTF